MFNGSYAVKHQKTEVLGMLVQKPRIPLLSALAGVMFVASGCTSIHLVSNYDEIIDNQAQQLQKKLDGYFISLQSTNG